MKISLSILFIITLFTNRVIAHAPSPYLGKRAG